jgi:energy-coupling factor transporter ATP-binding protein EcfA2
MELEIDGLRRRYGAVTALDELTFGVPAGQVFGFLGPNGAGKTTTMRAIFGVTALDAGEIRWRGKPVDEAARRTFGYMPEERGLNLAQSWKGGQPELPGRGGLREALRGPYGPWGPRGRGPGGRGAYWPSGAEGLVAEVPTRGRCPSSGLPPLGQPQPYAQGL